MKKVKTIYPDKPAKSFNEWANHIHGHFRSPMDEEMEQAKQRITTKFYRP